MTAVAAAHDAIDRHLDRWHHIVVTGPRYDGPALRRDGMTVVESEPHLVDLLALADLVIARAGYNTVNELRVTGTPAILLPGVRRHDDQLERARACAREGRAEVVEDARPESLAALLDSPERLARTIALGGEAIAPRGNDEAARQILALLANE